MGLIKSLLLRRGERNFESVFSRLETKIRTSTAALQSAKKRQKTFGAILLLLTLSIVSFLIIGVILVPHWLFKRLWDEFTWLKAAFPLLLFAAARLFSFFLAKRVSYLEERIYLLKKEQKSQVEELKKISGYYETKSLLERYDQSQPREEVPQSAKLTEQTPRPPVPAAPSQLKAGPLAVPVSAPKTPAQIQSSRGWMDRLIDAVLAEQPTHYQYALICKKCHVHNGLCRMNEVEEKIFKCMHCQFVNDPGASTPASALQPDNTNEIQVQAAASESSQILPSEPTAPSDSAELTASSASQSIESATAPSSEPTLPRAAKSRPKRTARAKKQQ